MSELIREKRAHFRDSSQEKRMTDIEDDEGDGLEDISDDKSERADSRLIDDWNKVLTPEEKAVLKARKSATLAYGSTGNKRLLGSHRGPQGSEVEFAPVDETVSFAGCNLLKVFEEARSRVSGASARVLLRGSILISVTAPRTELLWQAH